MSAPRNPFDPAYAENFRARKSDPESSHEGAAKATAQARTIADAILFAIPPCGMTTEEISDSTGIGIQIVSPQMVHLERAGKVKREWQGHSLAGKDRYKSRKNRSGVRAIIWYCRAEEIL